MVSFFKTVTLTPVAVFFALFLPELMDIAASCDQKAATVDNF